ncbi:MAG: cell wall hydrolase [Sediminimonas sp.]|uniref:cell wall hydrolase n=1 Tax=Sediminimonas sp. TaxID=2823379 RepID=UPI00287093DD|nr:cell wall hydrolase [Sediminimonas sp.]MDR9484580.1 cell wall hydrolase [Sediminimonas sp.]
MRMGLAALFALVMGTSGALAETPLTDVLLKEKQGLKSMRGALLEQMLLRDEGPAGARYSQGWLDKQPAAKGGQQWQCLTEALYFEARGETVMGQFAVAEVIMNRAESSRFPGSVCGVVKQGAGRGVNRCQFSYACDGRPETMSEAQAVKRAGKIARIIVDGGPRPLTKGATYYHAKWVSPRWSRKFARTATIGVHHFYKPALEISQN